MLGGPPDQCAAPFRALGGIPRNAILQIRQQKTALVTFMRQSSNTTAAITAAKWNTISRGEVFQKPIISVKEVVVAGVTKFVINELYWSKVRPSSEAAFVNLQHVEIENGQERQTVVNVISYSDRPVAMSLEDKIAVVRDNPDVAMALATLLR